MPSDDDTIRLIRRCRPASVVAIDEGGNERELSIPRANRGRWEAVARIAGTYLSQGARVELRDQKGAVVWVLEPEAPAIPIDETKGAPDSLAGLVSLIVKAQDHAMERFERLIKPTLDAHVEMHRIQMDRLAHHERMYATTLRALYDATLARAEADASREPNPTDTIAAAFMAQLPAAMAQGNGSK